MEINQRSYWLVSDVDGSMTDGGMYYTSAGKVMKKFNGDDTDALKALSSKIEISFITGDKKGFPIVEKRMSEIGFPVTLVSHLPEERWKWIEENNKENKEVIFIGDGIYDYECLRNARYSFTFCDSLEHVKNSADFVLERRGGNRAVAEACIMIDSLLKLRVFPESLYKTFTSIENAIKSAGINEL